jgi:hypothetical protein
MRFLLIVGTTASLATGILQGQQLGIGGGVTLPQGDLNAGTNQGWHALGSLMFGSPMQPMGLRVDVHHTRLPFTGALDGNSSVTSATLNLSYRLLRATAQVSPYVIAGLGAYRTACSDDLCEAQIRYGWNAGGGFLFRVAGLQAFLEGRFHRTTIRGEDVHFFPVTLGFRL